MIKGKSCTVRKCANRPTARGLCSTHYSRWLRHGDVQANKPVQPRYERSGLCSAGCGGAVWARGLCVMHYARWRSIGVVGPAERIVSYEDPGVSEKRCVGCGHVKPLSDFKPAAKRRNGVTSRCAVCLASGMSILHLRRNYGLSAEDHQEMRKSQDNRCAICKEENDRLYVDHNHDTGAIRGLLCNRCNVLLGFASDSVGRLREAADYLERRANSTKGLVAPMS